MKKNNVIKIFLILYLIYKAFTAASLINNAVSEGIARCINIVIPSLFFMMVVSDILIKSSLLCKISSLFNKISKFIFGMNGEIFLVYIMSMFMGYPIGARLLTDYYENNKISKIQAEIYLSVCYGAGPAFIFGILSASFYKDAAANIVIISTVSANIILAVIMRIIYSSELKNNELRSNRIFNINISDFSESVSKASRSLLSLCSMIIIFSVFSALIKSERIYNNFINNEFIGGIISSILDISAIAQLNIYSYTFLPIISGLISFGGICVIMQIYTIVGQKFSIKKFVITRIIAGILSNVIATILCRIIITDKTAVSVSAGVNYEISNNTTFSSIMLVFMMFITFVGYSNSSKNNRKI